MSTTSSSSSSFVDTATGHHVLKVSHYSSTRHFVGERVLSRPFTVGGHFWRIAYYPYGIHALRRSSCIAIYLLLDECAPGKLVKARFQFRLVPAPDEEEPRHCSMTCFPASRRPEPAHFDSGEVRFASHGIHGCEEFIRKKELIKKHLRDDSFAVRCDIVVYAAPSSVSVLPPDLGQHLGDLLGANKGADVEFLVGGRTFAAHRCLLAARSPVFAAQLFGSMREGRRDGGVIRVSDMEARVFEALLQFMYTDSWPEVAEEDECTMAQHLLVAADRYGMERLKSICEHHLCYHIGLATAAHILELAELHHCQGLKAACIDFLQAPGNLTAAMAGAAFEHLSRICPSLAQELIAMRDTVDH